MTGGQQGVITVESGKFDHGSAQIVKLDSTEIIVSNQQYFHPGTFVAIDDPQYRLHLTVSQPTVLNFQLLQSPGEFLQGPTVHQGEFVSRNIKTLNLTVFDDQSEHGFSVLGGDTLLQLQIFQQFQFVAVDNLSEEGGAPAGYLDSHISPEDGVVTDIPPASRNPEPSSSI